MKIRANEWIPMIRVVNINKISEYTQSELLLNNIPMEAFTKRIVDLLFFSQPMLVFKRT